MFPIRALFVIVVLVVVLWWLWLLFNCRERNVHQPDSFHCFNFFYDKNNVSAIVVWCCPLVYRLEYVWSAHRNLQRTIILKRFWLKLLHILQTKNTLMLFSESAFTYCVFLVPFKFRNRGSFHLNTNQTRVKKQRTYFTETSTTLKPHLYVWSEY